MERSKWSSEGRISMKTYWLRLLICLIISGAVGSLTIILSVIGMALTGITNFILSIFMIIQGVKRMHDVDKSGWFLLIPLVNLIFCLTPGTNGPNRFGEDPKQPAPAVGTEG